MNKQETTQELFDNDYQQYDVYDDTGNKIYDVKSKVTSLKRYIQKVIFIKQDENRKEFDVGINIELGMEAFLLSNGSKLLWRKSWSDILVLIIAIVFSILSFYEVPLNIAAFNLTAFSYSIYAIALVSSLFSIANLKYIVPLETNQIGLQEQDFDSENWHKYIKYNLSREDELFLELKLIDIIRVEKLFDDIREIRKLSKASLYDLGNNKSWISLNGFTAQISEIADIQLKHHPMKRCGDFIFLLVFFIIFYGVIVGGGAYVLDELSGRFAILVGLLSLFFAGSIFFAFYYSCKNLVTGAVSLALNGTTHSISIRLKSKNKVAHRVYFDDGYYAAKLYTDIVKEMPSAIK